MFAVDNTEAEDEQGDDDGYSCSWWNYDVQEEADMTVLQTDQGLVSGWSSACRKNQIISIEILLIWLNYTYNNTVKQSKTKAVYFTADEFYFSHLICKFTFQKYLKQSTAPDVLTYGLFFISE